MKELIEQLNEINNKLNYYTLTIKNHISNIIKQNTTNMEKLNVKIELINKIDSLSNLIMSNSFFLKQLDEVDVRMNQYVENSQGHYVESNYIFLYSNDTEYDEFQYNITLNGDSFNDLYYKKIETLESIIIQLESILEDITFSKEILTKSKSIYTIKDNSF